MARDNNKNKVILKDCKECISNLVILNKIYCKLRIKNNKPSPSAIVEKQDCVWFKGIK